MESFQPWMDAPTPQNEASSHSFVESLPMPLNNSMADDSDEWEYEYSTTESEVSAPPNPPHPTLAYHPADILPHARPHNSIHTNFSPSSHRSPQRPRKHQDQMDKSRPRPS